MNGESSVVSGDEGAKSSFDSSRAGVMQKILREWKTGLTPQEWEIVLFVYDRTYGWDKIEEAIPWRHFLNGMKSEGVTYAYPLFQKQTSLFHALKSLETKGVMRVSKEQILASHVYELNTDWSPVGWERKLAPISDPPLRETKSLPWPQPARGPSPREDISPSRGLGPLRGAENTPSQAEELRIRKLNNTKGNSRTAPRPTVSKVAAPNISKDSSSTNKNVRRLPRPKSTGRRREFPDWDEI